MQKLRAPLDIKNTGSADADLKCRVSPERHTNQKYYIHQKRPAKHRLAALAAAITLASTTLLTPFAALAADTSILGTTPLSSTACVQVQFVFARGSGSPLGDADYQAFYSAMSDVAEQHGISYKFYELGTEAQGDAQYPAVEIGNQSLKGVFTAAGALVSAGQSHTYGESVSAGISELATYVKETLASCPTTRFVIGGYSQGAQVVSSALPKLNSQKVLYAATFGDPKLYLPEGKLVRGSRDACLGKNLSHYRADVTDCEIYDGILGATDPYDGGNFTAAQANLGAWCNSYDLMCGSSWDWSNLLGAHLAYNSDGSYAEAAAKVSKKLSKNYNKILGVTERSSGHDIVITIDSSGSMAGYIEQYKEEALRLAQENLAAGGRVALYEYRDLDDPYDTIQHCDFSTCDYETFKNELNKIKTRGGGDSPESALSATLQAMNDLSWQDGANKSVLLLTDDTYLDPDRDGTTYEQVVQRSFQIDPVNIYTLTPEKVREDYQQLTADTGGKTFSLGDDISLSTDYILSRPTAKLDAASYTGTVGETLTFDASSSTAKNGIDHYEWDLDADGTFEKTTNTATVQQTYTEAVDGFVQVKVVDQAGEFSTMSASIEITELPTQLASAHTTAEITDFSVERLSNTSFRLHFQTSADTAQTLLVIDGAIMGFVEDGVIINEVTTDMEIALTPISTSGQRGESVSSTLEGRVLKLAVPDCGVGA